MLTAAQPVGMQALLFGVSPSHQWSLVGAFAILVTVAIGASLIPATRAARTDPMAALRHE